MALPMLRRVPAAGFVVACLSACGKIDAGPDASSKDGASVARCDSTQQFSAAVPLTEIAAPAWGFRLTPDELAAVFDSGSGIYMTTRADLASAFRTPTLLAFSATYPTSACPSLSGDALTLFFYGQKSATAAGLFMVTRAGSTLPFGGDTLLAAPPTGSVMTCPFVTSDGLTLYYTPVYSGGVPTVSVGPVVEATRSDPTSAFGTAAPVLDDGTLFGPGTPVVSNDGLTLFVAESAADAGSVVLHVRIATRSSVGATFGTPLPLPELDSEYGEWPSWISVDQCRLYFTRLTTTVNSSMSTWVASRSPR